MRRDDLPLAEPEEGTLHLRTVWISDLHLGTPGCQAKALLHFLKTVECETLYLVGDIVDGWQLRRSWFWPQAHNDVVQKLLRKARKGTHVVFVPGNHDEFARKYLGHNFGGIEVVEEAIHTLADGRKFPVTAIHATEQKMDLAIIKVDGKDLASLELGNSDALQQGESVVAIGNPIRFRHSVVAGVASGKREIDGRPIVGFDKQQIDQLLGLAA